MKDFNCKKIILLIFLFSLFFNVNLRAQVTIGSSQVPDADALLDLKENVDKSSTKGLLLPRVSLSKTNLATPLSAHVKGMTVYNIADENDVTPGYYYNDGTKWVKLATDESTIVASFFYMPSIVLPTDILDPNYDGGTETFTINLYQSYTKQFNLADATSSTKNQSATTLPVLASNKLEFFITYYDNSVFQNVVVNNDGVLTYKLAPSFNITEKTFMNIIFRVK